MPFPPSSVRTLLVRPGAPSSFLLLVAQVLANKSLNQVHSISAQCMQTRAEPYCSWTRQQKVVEAVRARAASCRRETWQTRHVLTLPLGQAPHQTSSNLSDGKTFQLRPDVEARFITDVMKCTSPCYRHAQARWLGLLALEPSGWTFTLMNTNSQ